MPASPRFSRPWRSIGPRNEFLVTWDDGGDRGGVIFGQRVRGSDGALLGGNFPIGSIYGGIRSAVAWSPASASYLVVFWGPGPGGTAAEIYGQRVSAAGALLGANFNISADGAFSGYPAISWAASGNQFLVTWDNEDGNIHGRRVNAATGAPTRTADHRDERRRERTARASHMIPVNARWLVQFNDAANAGFSYDQYGAVRRTWTARSPARAVPRGAHRRVRGRHAVRRRHGIRAGRAAVLFELRHGQRDGRAGIARIGCGTRQPGRPRHRLLHEPQQRRRHRHASLSHHMGRTGRLVPRFSAGYSAPRPPRRSIFTAVPGDGQDELAWRNPNDPHFTGTMIRVKTSGFPADAGRRRARRGQSRARRARATRLPHTALANWTTYYYAAFAHDSGAELFARPRRPRRLRDPPRSSSAAANSPTGMDGWTLDVWRVGESRVRRRRVGMRRSGNMHSTGAGATNNNDACTREGSTMTRLISTTGRTGHSDRIRRDGRVASRRRTARRPVPARCSKAREDKLVVSFSTRSPADPWTMVQTLIEGVELPTGWTHKLINLAGVTAASRTTRISRCDFNGSSIRQSIQGAWTTCACSAAPSPPSPRRSESTPDRSSIARCQQVRTPADMLRIVQYRRGHVQVMRSRAIAPWLGVTPPSGVSHGPQSHAAVSYNTASLPVGDYVRRDCDYCSRRHEFACDRCPSSFTSFRRACLWEPFAYYDGALTTMAANQWSGRRDDELATASGALDITGGTGNVQAQRSVSCAGSNGIIAAEIKIRGGTGTGDFFWSIHLDDPAGNNFARWYGGSRHARGRIASTVTPDMMLSGPGEWDDLYVEINTAHEHERVLLQRCLLRRD